MKSIFKGLIIQKEYYFNDWNNKVDIYEKEIGYETFLETDLDAPPLNKDDEFYLIDHDKLVRIRKMVRGTDNVMVYYTNYILKTTEEFVESLEKAKETQQKYLERKEQDKIERARRKAIEEYEDTFFLKRLFMKKPE